ncbi:hypothetical protein QSI79_22655 [Enterobacter asburiae]|uniref:hypothetical protein n=1 Tax=Enterobacter asburiae TaxID=61645 RepID=UPI002879A37D|nr:hypothetical protein [Enterobacter asburiae]MDS1916093.1 hypothetical protein [Enterobacter asburiae]
MAKQCPSKQYLNEVISNREFAESVPPEIVTVMARQLLASMEHEPVAWRYRHHNGLAPSNWRFVEGEGECNMAPNYQRQPLYVAPPAPAAMKDHQIRELVNELRDIAVEYHSTQQLRERIAKTVRAAMLQGKAEPVSQRDELQEGWVTVPVDPTPEMLAEICLVDGWTERALRARYKAMLAAVPQPEVK